jgi:DNA-binding MarR family transcriptional regulator
MSSQPLTRITACVRIQKLNASMTNIKSHEYTLLDEIARDSMVTQAGLSERLGIAVGSVNWYIKRLIQRGWIKVSHLDRTRLRYDLTSRGMRVFTQRALAYARDSLKLYGELRLKAKAVVNELKESGVTQVYLAGSDELTDILRLTCIENGLLFSATPNSVMIKPNGHGFEILYSDPLQQNCVRHG